jgi:gliding-associated putative ABC transporter substrate-binding component GldG
MSTKKNINAFVMTLAVIGSLIFINILGTGLFRRADLTRDGEFTLNQATSDLLDSLDDPVTVRAYITKDLSARYAPIARYMQDILDEYYAEGGSSFRYEVIDPTAKETEEDKQKKKDIRRDIFGRMVREKTSIERELEGLGVIPFSDNVNEGDKIIAKKAYLGLVIKYNDKTEVIPQVQNSNEFEYALTTKLRKITRAKDPKIAFLTGHENPELYKKMRGLDGLLRETYRFTTIDISQKQEIDDDVDALLVVGPKTRYTDEQLRAVDKFVTSGHAAAFLLGPIDPDIKTLQANPVEHGLGKLLAGYGVELKPGLVLDQECSRITIARESGGMRLMEQVSYPFVLQPSRLRSDHMVTRKLSQVVLPFMGPLSVKESLPEGVDAQAIIRSSQVSWIQQPPYDLNPDKRWRRDEVGELRQRDLMIGLSGPIPSQYKDSQQEETAAKSRIIVAAGHAFVQDQFMAPGNQALILNIMDWLLMDDAMLSIRSRGLAAAPLEQVSDGTRSMLKLFNILGLPLLLIAFGVIRWRIRESRRSRVAI